MAWPCSGRLITFAVPAGRGAPRAAVASVSSEERTCSRRVRCGGRLWRGTGRPSRGAFLSRIDPCPPASARPVVDFPTMFRWFTHRLTRTLGPAADSFGAS